MCTPCTRIATSIKTNPLDIEIATFSQTWSNDMMLVGTC